MLENDLVVGSKILKIPQKKKAEEEEVDNSDNLTTFAKSKVKLNSSILNYMILLLALNGSTSIAVYLLHSKAYSTIVLSLLPSLIMILLIVFFKVYLKIYHFSVAKVFLIYIFLYTTCSLVLVFTDLNIVSSFLGRSERSLIPNMFYLLTLAKQCANCFSTKTRLLLVVNLAIAVFSLSISFGSLQPIEISLFQFFLYTLLLPYKNIRTPKQFKVEDAYKINQVDEEGIPIEIVMKMLAGVLDEFEEISICNNCESAARKSFLILESVVNILRNSPNIYSSNIDKITRNMDGEDKLFIEQGFSDKSIYSSMNDSDDVRENLNIVYGANDLAGVLKQIGNEWNFNTFFVADCSGDMPLQICGEYIFKKYNFDKAHRIPEPIYLRFLTRLEQAYWKNPYHNSCHATDMLISFLYFMHTSGFIKRMNSLELLSCVMACLAHDVGHKGKSNRFLILSKDSIALKYNDISVQEMMHAAILFDILMTSDSNILSVLDTDHWFSVRKIIVEMILSTDMQKHFELLGVFKAKYLSSLQAVDLNESEVKLDVFKLGIKCADLGHAAKSIEIHTKWCGLIIQEFFEQGDMEKDLGMPVSMYCDRETTDISKSQAGFLLNVVTPIYAVLSGILRCSELDLNCVAQIKRNKNYWSTRRSLSKNQTVLIKKQQEYKQKEYLDLMEKANGLKRSITPFVANLSP